MLKPISIVRFSLLCFVLGIAVPAFPLDWKDKEWLSAGCPMDTTGYWTLREETAGDEKFLEVGSSQIFISSEKRDKTIISFSKDSPSKGPIILRLNESDVLKAGESFPNLPYWKVRPHRIVSQSEADKDSSISSPCLIKVFRYRNKEQIPKDKYVSWRIYFIN